MAGYSGTPLAKKLGIKGKAAVDVVVVFVTKRSELIKRFAQAAARLSEQTGSGVWVAWPKKSSGVATDITEDVIREVCLPSGLVDNKVCAIDETWSGLRMVRRRN
jgi:hypothetical protein